jgi:hypothetical protein
LFWRNVFLYSHLRAFSSSSGVVIGGGGVTRIVFLSK